jgi:hypothetical protein
MSKIIKSCKNCGLNFESYVRKAREYCSRSCSNQNYSMRTKLECNCEECGVNIKTTKSRKRRFCSVNCRNLHDSKTMVGSNNPNFGKRRPNMYAHTNEAKQKIKTAVTNSWKTTDRLIKQQDFLQKYKEEHGYFPMQSIESQQKKYISLVNSLGTRKYGGWKGIKCGWHISTKTQKQEYYASSYELNRMIELDTDDKVVSWTKQHPFLVDYILLGQSKKYKPDFYIEYDNGNCVVEEIKGFIKIEDRQQYCEKVKFATEYFTKLGIEYFVNFKYNLRNEVVCG